MQPSPDEEMQLFNYDVLEALVSIADVDLLVALWRFSSYQGPCGEQFREFMTASLPSLCERYQLAPVQSFQEFVEAYDEKVYTSLYTGTPNDCLWFFASEGDLRNVKIALKKGADDFDAVVAVAAQNDHLHVVKYIGPRASGGEINRAVEKAASGRAFGRRNRWFLYSELGFVRGGKPRPRSRRKIPRQRRERRSPSLDRQ